MVNQVQGLRCYALAFLPMVAGRQKENVRLYSWCQGVLLWGLTARVKPVCLACRIGKLA